MNHPRFAATFLFLGTVLRLAAQDAPPFGASITTGVSGTYDLDTNLSSAEQLGVAITSDHIDLNMDLEMNNDRKYGSDTIYLSTGNDLGNYFLVNRGDVVLKGAGMRLQLGRFRPVDEVVSPYSLVLNPNALAQTGAKFSYQAGRFSYSTEWIQLNYQSKFGSTASTPPAWQYTWDGTQWVPNGTGFPDRGTVVHNFVYDAGSWRFGLQDQSIYSGRSFDSEYFFSPMPQYFTEYLRTMAGRPWTASGELDKYMMGFFADWKEDGQDAYVQFQMADFNLHFLNPSLLPNNPAKFAWSLGGHVTNDWGRWGFFHAGATKYMYEAMTVSPGSESIRDVGNSYFPDTVYNRNGTFVPIDRQSNQIGYTKGENNLAFQARWENTFANDKLHLAGGLEFVVAGSNSPANPWQGEYQTSSGDLGTQLLNEAVLEKTVQVDFGADWAVDSWTFSGHLTTGEVFNVLQLRNPPGYAATPPTNLSVLTSLVKIWVPSDENQGIFTISLGVKYSYDATALLNP